MGSSQSYMPISHKVYRGTRFTVAFSTYHSKALKLLLKKKNCNIQKFLHDLVMRELEDTFEDVTGIELKTVDSGQRVHQLDDPPKHNAFAGYNYSEWMKKNQKQGIMNHDLNEGDVMIDPKEKEIELVTLTMDVPKEARDIGLALEKVLELAEDDEDAADYVGTVLEAHKELMEAIKGYDALGSEFKTRPVGATIAVVAGLDKRFS